MGYNSTVIVMNDGLDQIEKDPEFGKKLAQAIRKLSILGGPVCISSGYCANVAYAVETHHANNSSIVAVGGNHASVLTMVAGDDHGTAREEFVKRTVQELSS